LQAAVHGCQRVQQLRDLAQQDLFESLVVGDFLLGQAFKMMVEVGSLQALDVLSTAAAVIAEGEVMQLAAAKNTETTEDEYLAVVRAKTAALFAAALNAVALIGVR
jgi:octaprenyl-diphosphate synthase